MNRIADLLERKRIEVSDVLIGNERRRKSGGRRERAVVQAPQGLLESGVDETGCTVHLVTEDVDSGPILAQEAVPVREGDTEETLHERIKEVERRLYPDVIEQMVRASHGVQS